MDSEEDATSCSVCREIYSDPRSLPCGHSFCLKCLKGVAGIMQKFPCPVCRFNVDLRDINVDQLPKNFVLSSVIEARDKTHLSMCLDHKKSLDLFCEVCDVAICSKCFSMKHKGHAIEEIDKIFNERNTQLAAFLDSARQWASMTQEKIDVVKQSRISMENNIDSISKTVENIFKKWHHALQKQNNNILSYIHQERDLKRQVFYGAERVLEGYMTMVTGIGTEISKLRTKGTAFVVQEYGSIKARQEDTKRKILQDIKTCFTPQDHLEIEVYAPWIEEAIENIKPIDSKQTQARPEPQKIAEIQGQNVILMRRIYTLEEKQKIDQTDLNKKIQEQKEQILTLVVQVKKTKQECSMFINEKEALSIKVKTYETLLNEEKDKAEKEILRLKKDKDDLLNRLSKVASDKLTHENTDITDLSDKNRPSMLAEKISELYDNQYTDAFDECKANRVADKDTVQLLLRILMETHQLCKELTQKRYHKLIKASSCLEISTITDGKDKMDKTMINEELSIELQQDIKRIWCESSKSLLTKARSIIENRVANQFGFPILTMHKAAAYMTRCIDLCWAMNLQEKPMHLDSCVQLKDGYPYFDSEKFRSYTRTGECVAFVVWSALYLFEEGAMLRKGIAQGSSVAEWSSDLDVSCVTPVGDQMS